MSKVFIQEDTLTSIGDAIRGKAGSTDLIDPANMAQAIANIPSGGIEDLEIRIKSGTSAFANNNFNLLLTKYPQCIKFDFKEYDSKSSTMNNMFGSCNELEAVNLTISNPYQYGVDISNMFNGCSRIRTLPKIITTPTILERMFSWCYLLENITSDKLSLDWAKINAGSGYAVNNFIQYCASLKYISPDIISQLYANKSSGGSWQSITIGLLQHCYSLPELLNLPVSSWNDSSTSFTDFLANTASLSRFTFAPTDQMVMWNNQTIDATRFGNCESIYFEAPSYWNKTDFYIDKNGAITTIEELRNRYNQIKNDEWYSISNRSITIDGTSYKIAKLFSHYNRLGAVETLQSLPQLADGKHCVIKFTSYQGKETDGGQIGDLTEEEIAVAAAKGWTVSIV